MKKRRSLGWGGWGVELRNTTPDISIPVTAAQRGDDCGSRIQGSWIKIRGFTLWGVVFVVWVLGCRE